MKDLKDLKELKEMIEYNATLYMKLKGIGHMHLVLSEYNKIFSLPFGKEKIKTDRHVIVGTNVKFVPTGGENEYVFAIGSGIDRYITIYPDNGELETIIPIPMNIKSGVLIIHDTPDLIRKKIKFNYNDILPNED